MNAFQMLLVLGFPPVVAAAMVAPEIFRTESNDAETDSDTSAGS